MTTGRKVEAAPLFARPLELFATKTEAWAHLVKHVLNHKGEFGNWGILIPDLQAALDAGRRQDLFEKARGGAPDRVPLELEIIWPAFLDLLTAAIRQGIGQEWYWEEHQVAEPGTVRAFAASGILAYLDSTTVRTGFLPIGGALPAACSSTQERRYQLFFECWRKVRFKYQRAEQDGRVVKAPSALQNLMRKVIDRPSWNNLW